ncbi:MAG: nucleoside-diphosphate sugar epimerase [Bacteroidetes bacterium]|nr:MAG: nucleoside-diphosphate sugar epimerase [Bacteroidota bacterium]
MILITGGTGLIGMHVAYELTRRGQRVRLLYRKSSNRQVLEQVFHFYNTESAPQLALIDWVEGDLSDLFSLEDAMEGVRHVYHCAASVSFIPAEREQMLKNNIEGTANLVNAAMEKKISRLCHVSSVATLGKNENGSPADENTHWKNSPKNSWYAISKYGAEREAWRASEEGLDVIIVNPSLVLGPGDQSRSSLEVFATAKKGLRWYTDGMAGFVDVRDVAAAMIALMESDVKNERFVLSAENLGFKTAFDRMLGEFGHKPTTKKLSPFLGELAWRLEKIFAALSGRRPRIVKETIRAAQEKIRFDGSKIKRVIPAFEYRPVEKSIAEFCTFYK